MSDLFLVFDVESVGLHGEAFAVGYCLVSRERKIETGSAACDPDLCRGTAVDRTWIEKNVPALPVTMTSPLALRSWFWRRWTDFKAKGAVLVSDCGWPVEARFLAACVDDDPVARTWEGPYPLHDLASILLAKGYDPMKTYAREPDELPVHHPMADASQSARLLLLALRGELDAAS